FPAAAPSRPTAHTAPRAPAGRSDSPASGPPPRRLQRGSRRPVPAPISPPAPPGFDSQPAEIARTGPGTSNVSSWEPLLFRENHGARTGPDRGLILPYLSAANKGNPALCPCRRLPASKEALFMSTSRSSSRPGRAALRAVLALLVVLALALLGLYAFIRARAGALQAGAAFTFDYTVTSTASEPSLAYSTLRSLDALTGSVAGQSSGDSLYLAWYNTPASAFQSEQAPGPDQAFTDLYVKDGQVYLNVRQIYRTLLSGLTAQYPAASALIPDWRRGAYITQAQLARLLNSQPAVAAAGGYSAAAFAPGQMQRAYAEGALDGYLYLTPKQETGDVHITLGFPLRSLWSEFFHCHVLVELPGQGLRFELTGRALPGEYDIQAPASVMRDEDIDALAAIFEAVRSLLAFVQELAGAAK